MPEGQFEPQTVIRCLHSSVNLKSESRPLLGTWEVHSLVNMSNLHCLFLASISMRPCSTAIGIVILSAKH